MTGDTTKNILLVNPWIHDFAAYDLWSRPLGLWQIAAELRQRGFKVGLLDCLDPRFAHRKKKRDGSAHFIRQIIPRPTALARISRRFARYGMTPDHFREQLGAAHRPEAILVTSMMTYWYTGVMETIAELRSAWPKAPIVLGGIYPTLLPEHARLNSGADLIAQGGGPTVLEKMLSSLGFNARPPGTNSQPPLSPPWPAWDLYGPMEVGVLMTSIGCPESCPYCASKLLSPGYESRPIEDVTGELRAMSVAGIRQVALYDDALLFNAKRHFIPIFREIAENGLQLIFHCPNGLHARLMTGEVASLMARAGFATLRLSYDRRPKVARNREAVKASADDLSRALSHLEEAGYQRAKIGVYLLAGRPGQELDELDESIEEIRKLGARPHLAEYSPVPRTLEYKRANQLSSVDLNEPLWHNNTLMPYRIRDFDVERYEALKKQARS